MATARNINTIFSVKFMTVADYTTGEPIGVMRELDGGSINININATVVELPASDSMAASRVDVSNGSIGVEATVKELPEKLNQYANQGSLTTTAACASAYVSSITDKVGSSISTKFTSLAVSAGQHSSIVRDTIYVEALSSTTFKMINYSKGQQSGTLTASGSARVIDVAPNISMSIASGLTTGDSGTFTITPPAGTKDVFAFGTEIDRSNVKYVRLEGEAHNSSDDNLYHFVIYKALITGISTPMTQGDFAQFSVGAMAMIDDTLSTPAALEYEILRGE